MDPVAICVVYLNKFIYKDENDLFIMVKKSLSLSWFIWGNPDETSCKGRKVNRAVFDHLLNLFGKLNFLLSKISKNVI